MDDKERDFKINAMYFAIGVILGYSVIGDFIIKAFFL